MRLDNQHKLTRVNWLGITALSFGGCNLSFFLFGPLFSRPGTISALLLVIGLFATYLAAPGWLRLVLNNPTRVGGITVAAALRLRHYSEILGTIIGIGYWIAWIVASYFGTIFFSDTLHHWILPSVPIPLIACAVVFISLGLIFLGLRPLSIILTPIALLAFILVILSIALPVFSGQVNWSRAFTYTWEQPFPGWFGFMSSIAGGLYFVGWLAPAFESCLCFMGEMKGDKRTIWFSAILCLFIVTVFSGIMPTIWLGSLGVEPLRQEIMPVSELSNLFSSLGKTPAILLAIAFMMINTFLSIITPLCNAPRVLVQLAEDGFIPQILSMRTKKTQVPLVATLFSAALIIFFILFGTDIWLIAATNFDYLVCISVSSFAASRLIKERDGYKDNDFSSITINLGLLSAGTWIFAMIFGFQQFHLLIIVSGVLFSFSGALFWLARKMLDNYYLQKKPWIFFSLELKFIGVFFLVLTLDSIGYLLAVNYIVNLGSVPTPLVTLLENIFITVALISISFGLIVPGTIVSAMANVTRAAKQLSERTLLGFSQAMIAFGKGKLEKASVDYVDVRPLPVHSHDELGEMTKAFNLLQTEIIASAKGLQGAREKLIQARKELLEINQELEKRVNDRTKKLSEANENLQKILQELTTAQDRLIEISKMTLLENLISGVINQISGPIGIAVTAISYQKEELNKTLQNFNDKKITEKHLKSFLDNSAQSTMLIENNLTRAVNLFSKFKQVSSDQLTDLLIAKNFYLKEYLEFIILNMKTFLKKSLITVSLECPENLVVKSYAGVLFQVISILMNNSLTHGFKPDEEGHITVRVHSENDQVTLEYSDTGCGIEPENINRIFDPFFTTKFGKGSLGLGLHIARSRIVRILNGTIECKSVVGHGTTFIITFPTIAPLRVL